MGLYFEWIVYGEERTFSENREWDLFPAVDKKSWFKTFHNTCREPLSLQSWIHAVLAKMRWLFYFLLSSSSLLNPQEQSAGAFQWGYWIFYWQASTKELVPIATIWKSLFPQGSHKGEHIPSYTIPAENNARKPTTSSEAYKSLCWSPAVSLALNKEQIHMLEMSIPNSLSGL